MPFYRFAIFFFVELILPIITLIFKFYHVYLVTFSLSIGKCQIFKGTNEIWNYERCEKINWIGNTTLFSLENGFFHKAIRPGGQAAEKFQKLNKLELINWQWSTYDNYKFSGQLRANKYKRKGVFQVSRRFFDRPKHLSSNYAMGYMSIASTKSLINVSSVISPENIWL